jgi:bacillithiol synthase
MKVEHVGYDLLRSWYPALFISYCLDDGRASKFFSLPYRDEKGLIERAKRAAEKGTEPGVIETLRRYHQECGAPKESLAALEKLGRGAAAVVTGQQPSVGWGPLYNLYKAQAALKFAQAIEARGVPCVAIFWNHSDDVRGGNSVTFPDRENVLREVPLPPSEPGTPLCETGSPETLRMFASVLAEALPRTEFTPWIAEFLGATHRGNVAESFSRMLLGLLGQFGLVVLEPRHLEGARASMLFSQHLADPSRLARAVEAGRQAVIAEKFDDQLGKDVGLDLFDIRNGRRTKLEKPGPVKGRLSAGVALRPLLQDAVLPTCAYVAGPSEVGYQAELLPAYRAFKIEPPVVFPRVTATLLEPKIAKVVDRAGLKAGVLFSEEGALAPRFLHQEEDVAGELAKLPDRMMAEVADLMKKVSASPSVSKAQERTATKVKEALEALADRVKDELARQDTTGRGQLMKLLCHVRPESKLQERVFTPFYYASLFGSPLFGKLVGTLDPFVFSHQIITIL